MQTASFVNQGMGGVQDPMFNSNQNFGTSPSPAFGSSQSFNTGSSHTVTEFSMTPAEQTKPIVRRPV
jgi:hypothetical protein